MWLTFTFMLKFWNGFNVLKEETKTTVKAENKEEVKKVKTGDDENIIGVVLLLIGSLVVLTYIKKKRIE